MLYKVLDSDGSCFHGGAGKWNLPTKNADGAWEPGEWMPPIKGELVRCKNGYHLCRLPDLLGRLGPAIYEAEYRGDHLDCEDEVVVREARLLWKCEGWNESSQRLFACDCAERVLPLYEREYPGDMRPRRAIEVARSYAEGKCSAEELRAASDEACDAEWGGWDDARSSAWTVWRVAARVATLVAERASGVAAGAAAWEAAYAIAVARGGEHHWWSERAWQMRRLRELLEREYLRGKG